MNVRLWLLILVTALPCAGAEEQAVRAAILKSLPLLERSSAITIEERSNCFTCHHTGLPVLTLSTARERGFGVDARNLEAQIQFTAAFLAKGRANYASGKGQGGQAYTAGSALWTLELGGHKPDATTEAVMEFLLDYSKDANHWKSPSDRPPSVESPFSTTFVVLKGLKTFGTPAQQERMAQRTARARDWLLKTPAKSTEDKVFKLWSLAVTDADRAATQQAAQDLLHLQREDGGWAQLDGMSSDAYATGTALVALHRTGFLAENDAGYDRGVNWLIQAQLDDGSWHVVSRSKPFQSYFESGYPHGKDQLISMTAACWATIALLEALSVVK